MNLLELTEPIPQISPDASLMEIARVMSARHLGVAAVVEKKRIVGILTERDLGRCAAGRAFEGLSLPARDAMTSPVDSIAATTPVTQAAELMRVRGIRYLALVSPKGEFLGIVTLRGIRQWLLGHLASGVGG